MSPITKQSYKIKIEFIEQTQEILLGLWKGEKMEEEEEELIKTILLFTYSIRVKDYKWIPTINFSQQPKRTSLFIDY